MDPGNKRVRNAEDAAAAAAPETILRLETALTETVSVIVLKYKRRGEKNSV